MFAAILSKVIHVLIVDSPFLSDNVFSPGSDGEY